MPKEPLPPTTGPDTVDFDGRHFTKDPRNFLLLPPLSPRGLVIPGNPNLERASAVQLGYEKVLETNDMVIVTGRGNPRLAYEIGQLLLTRIDYQPREVFPSGVSHVVLGGNNREKQTFIIQTTERGSMGTNVNDNTVDTFQMIDAAQKASSGKIRLIIPAYGHDRGDKRSESREDVPAAKFIDLFIKAGADSILTMDLHSPASEGATPRPVDNLFGSAALLRPTMRYLRERGVDLEDVIVVSPDAGGGKRALHYAGLMGLGEDHVEVLPKNRFATSEVRHLNFNGRFEGKVGVIIDDKFDTCGTLFSADEQLRERGVRMTIGVATHGIFSNRPWQERTSKKILASPIDHIIVTDTVVAYYDISANPKIEIVPTAPLWASAIRRIYRGEPLSGLLPDPKHPENIDWMCV